jgi:hypothetical protein
MVRRIVRRRHRVTLHKNRYLCALPTFRVLEV